MQRCRRVDQECRNRRPMGGSNSVATCSQGVATCSNRMRCVATHWNTLCSVAHVMRRRDALRNTSNGIPDFETGGIAHLPMNLQHMCCASQRFAHYPSLAVLAASASAARATPTLRCVRTAVCVCARAAAGGRQSGGLGITFHQRARERERRPFAAGRDRSGAEGSTRTPQGRVSAL